MSSTINAVPSSDATIDPRQPSRLEKKRNMPLTAYAQTMKNPAGEAERAGAKKERPLGTLKTERPPKMMLPGNLEKPGNTSNPGIPRKP
jgi:hypothetical protein